MKQAAHEVLYFNQTFLKCWSFNSNNINNNNINNNNVLFIYA